MQFPNELIALVIQQVNNAHTLHAMLTVSKDVFLLAAPALYRCPLWPDLSKTSGYKLIDWLLTISPSDDENVNLLRHIRHINIQARQTTRTTIDYLALVTDAQWVKLSWWECLAGWVGETTNGRRFVFAMHVRSYLTSAICDHRLEQIQSLSIESFDLRRYTSMAARFNSLSSIYIHFNPSQQFSDVCNDAALLVQAIQEHHGTSQLRSCRLSENIFVLKDNEAHRFRTNLTALNRLCSLLPEDPAAPRIPRSDGSFVILNRPTDSHLAELDWLLWTTEFDARSCYQDLTTGQFLQRCRSRTDMSVKLCVHNVNVFEWARDEAHQRDIYKDRMMPPVPVQSLQIRFSSQYLPPFDLQDVGDALDGFASSLLDLVLDLRAYHASAPSPWRLNEIARTLTLLKSITILTDTNLVIHPTLWTSCPSLTKLSIRYTVRHVCRQNCLDDEEGNLSWLWPVFQLPSLRELELHGSISTLLNPASFHHLPRLERITLHGMKQPDWMVRDHLLSLTYRWRSTWNWLLPNLRELDLQVDISQICFDFSMLRGCPNLKVIQIYGLGPNDGRLPLCVKPESTDIIDSATVGTRTRSKGDKECYVFPQLQKLTLRGCWTATFEELLYLLHHMLPGLIELRLGSQFEILGCNDQEWLEATRKHPCCTVLAAASLPMTSTLEELGLCSHWEKTKHMRAYHFADDVYGYLLLCE